MSRGGISPDGPGDRYGGTRGLGEGVVVVVVAVALIVLLLALLLTIGVVTGASESISVDLLGSEVTTSGSGLYVAGLLTGVAALASLWLLRVGLRKGWRQRKRIRDLERRAERADEPHGAPADDRLPADQDPTRSDRAGDVPRDEDRRDGDQRDTDRRDGDRQEPARAESGTSASDRDRP